MQELRAAVEAGLVKVEPYGAGFIVSGVPDDLLLILELENMGAVWDIDKQVYFIEAKAAGEEFKSLEKRSKAAAAALAARQARASKDGAKVFDSQRARQQKKLAKELRDVYQQALTEHQAELKAVVARYEAATDPEEAIKLGYRRDELESVLDTLADGMAQAGEHAKAITEKQLVESAAISRRVAAWQLDNMAGVEVSRFIGFDFAAEAITGAATYHGKFDLKAWQGVADKRKARQAMKMAITRGLLTGEHPSKIAKRIEGLFTGDEPLSPYKRAVRIAQTETASIMSQTTLDTMKQANEFGVKLKKRWDATLDGSTRDSHREVDGEVVDLDATFSNGLMRPGDGDAADRINCRCCLTEVLEGFEPDAPTRRDNETGETIPYMTYEEWERKKGLSSEPEPARKAKRIETKPGAKEPKPARTTKEPAREYTQAKHTRENWAEIPILKAATEDEEARKNFLASMAMGGARRGGINDEGRTGDLALVEVAKQQGFAGKPKKATRAEIDKLEKEGGIVMYRGVGDYKQAEQFIDGDYYAGTGVYGNGSYFCANPGYDPSWGLAVATHYAGMDESQNHDSGGVIRAVLSKDAKIITDKEARKLTESMMDEGMAAGIPMRVLDKTLADRGRAAALAGYDAIYVPTEDYYVVLNRTALTVEEKPLDKTEGNARYEEARKQYEAARKQRNSR